MRDLQPCRGTDRPEVFHGPLQLLEANVENGIDATYNLFLSDIWYKIMTESLNKQITACQRPANRICIISGVPRNFVRGGGSTNSVEDRGQRERGSGGGSPLVRGSGGSCNLVQEFSFHNSKIFLIFGTLRLFMMTTNLFVIANVKQLRT